jgi:hypothetical protein
MINKALKRLVWAIESVTWPLRSPFLRYKLSRSAPLGITIGVTTYKDRFEGCLRPLLPILSALFPGEQLIVIANGHYLEEEQHRYVERFSRFCASVGGIEAESYIEPKGLSYLWNRIIVRAQYPKVLILNDDIMLKPGFRRVVKRLLAGSDPVVTINSSWSHFLITREAFEKVGLFDEGFREIGGEDDDYLARMALEGIRAGNIRSTAISGRSKRRMSIRGLNSYGRDMSKESGGYSTLNTNYLVSKWETSDSWFKGAVEVPGRKTRYWKPRKQ